MLRRILLALGDDPSTTAASEICIDLAHQSEAHVTSLAMVDTHAMALSATTTGFGTIYYSYSTIHELEERLREEAEKRLSGFKRRAEEKDVETLSKVGEGAPWDCMESESRVHDLVVVGRHAHFRFGHKEGAPTPGKSLRKVLDIACCPVLCVSKAPLGRERVILAVDGRVPSSRAVQQFVQSGLLGQAKLTVFACDEGGALGRPDLDGLRRYLDAHQRRYELAECEGVARAELKRVLETRNADLVVMGAHGKPRLAEWILGSTTQDLLRESDVAVLVGH